jgi:putative hydrolase of the HAD superfamily
VTVEAVIFDWGGTLTPWHTIDAAGLWAAVCEPHFGPGQAAEYAAALLAAEDELWRLSRTEQRSATMSQVFERAGVTVTEAFLDGYVRAWEPHTFTDPDAAELLACLGARGIRVGVLSNTMWPRSWHEEVFRRDGVLDLIDGAVYSSEIAWTKPHPGAFQAAMAATVRRRARGQEHGHAGRSDAEQRRAAVCARRSGRRHQPPQRARAANRILVTKLRPRALEISSGRAPASHRAPGRPGRARADPQGGAQAGSATGRSRTAVLSGSPRTTTRRARNSG